MPRATRDALATGAACAPFRAHLAIERAKIPLPTSWAQVEGGFLEAMALFDTDVVAGKAEEGERQNGKGDYFNELIAIILEAGSGRQLSQRNKVKGLIFPSHNLDVTYPEKGIAEVLVEAKMLGTPKHPGSKKQKPAGRPARSDLLKRAKELGFKAIDLKAGFGLQVSLSSGSQAGPAGDLSTWSRASRPRTYFLLAVRVVNESDLRACIETCSNLQNLLDGVGLFAYTNDHIAQPPRNYAAAKYRAAVIPAPMEIGRVVYQISNVLKSLPVTP